MRKIKLVISALMLLLSVTALAQNITVKGVVSDTSGNPVPGAGVFVQGTNKGVATDFDGKYTLSVPAEATLVVSSVGYATQTVAVNGRSVVNVVLADDAQQLDETIVVAFGTTTKEAFTGSAAVLKSTDIQKRQTGNTANGCIRTNPDLWKSIVDKEQLDQ